MTRPRGQNQRHETHRGDRHGSQAIEAAEHAAPEEFEDFSQPLQTDTRAFPAREGFKQRWVRYQHRTGPDWSNMAAFKAWGFEPRSIDTIPPGVLAPRITLAGYGEVIGNHELVLMEIPALKYMRMKGYIDQRADHMEAAVRNNMLRINRKGEMRGSMHNKSSVSLGKGRSVHMKDEVV